VPGKWKENILNIHLGGSIGLGPMLLDGIVSGPFYCVVQVKLSRRALLNNFNNQWALLLELCTQIDAIFDIVLNATSSNTNY
jgi:hypothetical protein